MKGKGVGRGREEEEEQEEEEEEEKGGREGGKKKKKKRHVAHSTTLDEGVPFYSRGKLAGERDKRASNLSIFFFFFFFFFYSINRINQVYLSFPYRSRNGDKYDNSHGSNDLQL